MSITFGNKLFFVILTWELADESGTFFHDLVQSWEGSAFFSLSLEPEANPYKDDLRTLAVEATCQQRVKQRFLPWKLVQLRYHAKIIVQLICSHHPLTTDLWESQF